MPRPKKEDAEKEKLVESLEITAETEEDDVVVQIHNVSANITSLQKFESLIVTARKDIVPVMNDELQDAIEDVLMQLHILQMDLLLRQHTIIKELL